MVSSQSCMGGLLVRIRIWAGGTLQFYFGRDILFEK
jgi:hypothetical protein